MLYILTALKCEASALGTVPGEVVVTGVGGRIVDCIEKLDLKPDELWMIGDSYKHDITGAMDSSWHTIWINRRSLPKPDRLPDFEVTSDQELTSLLRSLFT